VPPHSRQLAADKRSHRFETVAAPVSQAASRRGISIARLKKRASLKASTIGRIGIIRKLADKNILGGIDLSERAIVPILSLVNTDPPPFGSAPRTEANQTVNSLPSAYG
jgi:hypothetical protein